LPASHFPGYLPNIAPPQQNSIRPKEVSFLSSAWN
jgi:hypothetical protein